MNRGLFLLAALFSFAASAQPADAPAPAPVDPRDTAHLTLPWTEPAGRGVSLGYDMGGLGNGGSGPVMENGVRVRIPFGRSFGLTVRVLNLLGQDGSGFRYDLGSRVELWGQTPVYLNLIRLYGGGGITLSVPLVRADDAGPKYAVQLGGGGQFGFEFFLHQKMSFFLEVGGNGMQWGAGPTVLAGANFYPF